MPRLAAHGSAPARGQAAQRAPAVGADEADLDIAAGDPQRRLQRLTARYQPRAAPVVKQGVERQRSANRLRSYAKDGDDGPADTLPRTGDTGRSVWHARKAATGAPARRRATQSSGSYSTPIGLALKCGPCM